MSNECSYISKLTLNNMYGLKPTPNSYLANESFTNKAKNQDLSLPNAIPNPLCIVLFLEAQIHPKML